MENTMDRYLGQVLDNRYEILEVLGYGGMAVVYKALCHRLNRNVAIKILKDEFADNADFREHFKAESQAVAMLSHPNIVAVYDFSKSPDCQYIVMELLEGITLKQYMQKKGSLSWKESLHFSTQTAKALSHAHSKGIVHRDIKPHNIMVGTDGSIKVADFGIAHLQNESAPDSGETMGSIHYISPEQARGEPADARSDIYSLGIVMYEMLTGCLPYEGETVEAVALQHFGAAMTLPGDINPEIPMRLERIALKAMTSDLNRRYQSADDLLDDLEEFRKQQFSGEPADEEPISALSYDSDISNKGLKPIGRAGELSKRDFARRKVRSRKVSTLSGIGLVILFLMTVLAFLWNYWIKDLLDTPERITIPRFIGVQASEITGSGIYDELYNFEVVYAVNPEYAEGEIIAQEPEAGRSIAPSGRGIDIKLTVSTGIIMTEIPNVVNHEYREAIIALEKIGFKVETETVASESITMDYVASTDPAAGQKIPAGSTIRVSISGGPVIVEFDMPSLLGRSRDQALAILAANQLSLGSITEEESDKPIGTVTWQNINAGEKVTKNTMVYLMISKGLPESPSPSPSPSPSQDITSPPPTQTQTPTTPVSPSAPVEGGGTEG